MFLIIGLIFNPTTWKNTRKFAQHSMRDFGLGKHSIDERIQDEAGSLVEIFRQKGNTAFDPQDDITKAISNIICSIAFGKRYRKIAKYSVAGSATHVEFRQGMISPNLPAKLNGVTVFGARIANSTRI